MLTDKKIDFNVLSVLKLHWDRGSELAEPRSYHALSIRLEGDAEFVSRGERYSVGKGEMIFVPKGRDYEIKARARERIIVVHFDIRDDEEREFEVISPRNPEIMAELFIKMHSAWEARKPGYEYRVDSLFARVMEGLVSEAFHKERGIKPDLSTLLDFIHTNFHDPAVSVRSLAKRMNVTETYLRRLFNEKFSTSPIRYLTRLRLDHAHQLLESGYYTVEEVARLSGYNDPKYFSTLFKRHFGISPGKTKRLDS
ncbi:MAG: helix-turn-helix transcriptional regulator [Clostridia bacterium]|nr:helix-turn-helix transcriptional regulator [Clostridia bacterium]